VPNDAEQRDRLKAALADRYAIERKLGVGGMATVYLAEDLRHDRKVALKVLRPELAAVLGAERFVREIKTTASLQHPHILPLFDSGEADSFLYYVMPYVEGETLRDKLDREKQLGIVEAVRITTEVADALDYAHRNSVIHRDIKPENILLHDGRPMVADFGIALAVSAAAGGRMTETGLSLGTPHYMSPEQATAEKDLTNRSDIYSLGAVLYEMLTGNPPHVGASAQQIIMKIVTEEAQPVTKVRKSVPPNMAAAVSKALEKLPADRFGTAAEFSAALANPGFALETVARSGTALPRAIPRGPRFWMAVAGAALVGLIAGAVLSSETPVAADPIRFSLTLGPGQRLIIDFEDDAPFAVSPDGASIVYAATDSGEARSRLFLRRLDQLEGIPLAGTEDARGPFFSPDGQWIAFATQTTNELKKMPIAGGPAVTLAQGVENSFGGGTWGDDGYVVYVAEDARLMRVSETGGRSESLVDLVDTAAFWPSALPGGEAVLVETCIGTCADRQVAVFDIASREFQELIPDARRAWFVDPDILAYYAPDGSVFGVRFDLGRREVTGEPVLLIEGVQTGPAGGGRLAVSRSGTVVYLESYSGTLRQMLEVNRAGEKTGAIRLPGQFEHPRWSPTGDRIALTLFGSSAGDASQIWIFDVASGTLSQLTFEGANFRPSWSPDGHRIAHYSNRKGATPDVYWIPADGSGAAEQVSADGDTRNVGPTFWTRDGAWIVVDGTPEHNDGVENSQGIYALGTGADRSRRTAVNVAGSDQIAPAVSPNGEWMAYISDETGVDQIYVRRFLAEGGRWQVSTGQSGTPLWTGNNEAQLELGGPVRVVQRRALFDFPYLEDRNVPQFDVSRDGERFLVLELSAAATPEPIVVVNWTEEIRRRMEGRRR
jgi:serine/threonine-protein kinase